VLAFLCFSLLKLIEYISYQKPRKYNECACLGFTMQQKKHSSGTNTNDLPHFLMLAPNFKFYAHMTISNARPLLTPLPL